MSQEQNLKVQVSYTLDIQNIPGELNKFLQNAELSLKEIIEDIEIAKRIVQFGMPAISSQLIDRQRSRLEHAELQLGNFVAVCNSYLQLLTQQQQVALEALGKEQADQKPDTDEQEKE